MATWDPWENPSYCWMVICKSGHAHDHTNLMFGHKILLGGTDPYETLLLATPSLLDVMTVA